MALLPIFQDFHDEFEALRPSRILNQHFGLGLTPTDLLTPYGVPLRSAFLNPYYRNWRSVAAGQDTGSTISSTKDKFEIHLDVQQFSPHEISVKATDDNNTIIVEGKHEEKKDEHGYISRHFIRKYVLPDEHDVKSVVSSLSSDGVLTITAPKKNVNSIESQERMIPITHTATPSRIAVNEEKK